MGKVGVVTPQVPLSSDIILGEFKVYANKGLPDEILIGSTRGGATVDIFREIREIGFDGAYGPTLDVDGVPLVRHDKLYGQIKLEQLYLRFVNSQRLDGNGWNDKNWTNTGSGTATQENTIILEDEKSYKFTGTATNNGINVQLDSARDLTEHQNGEEVDEDVDFIGIAAYITAANKTIAGDAKCEIRLHSDNFETQTDYFRYEILPSALIADQWNIFRIKVKDFVAVTSASWANITGASFIISAEKTTEPAQFEMYVSSLCLVQAFTKSSIVPVNSGNFKSEVSAPDRIYTPNLEILEEDYLKNITLVGQKHDGYPVKIILDNCFNDGALSLALQEKDEVVNSTQFTTHYNKATPTKAPLRIRFYKEAS